MKTGQLTGEYSRRDNLMGAKVPATTILLLNYDDDDIDDNESVRGGEV